MSKRDRVIIQYEETGETYGCPSAEIARERHPRARILRYADGRPFDQATDDVKSLSVPTGTRRRTRSADDAAVQRD